MSGAYRGGSGGVYNHDAMAEIRIIDNATRPAGDELLASLAWASDVRIATAFAKGSGVSRIIDPLAQILAKGGEVHVVYGLDFHITDPEAMEEFTRLAEEYSEVSHYTYSKWGLALNHAFHPKLYICADRTGSAQVMVGSSNLTRAGLWDNVETNTVVTGASDELAVVDARNVFNRISEAPTLFVPDMEYIEAYREVYERAALVPLTSEPPAELASAYEEIKRLEERLPGVDIGTGSGWAADILSCVRALQQETQTSEFTLREFTERFEHELRSRYPNNRHIDAKIRQQLQVLRDKNILVFLGGGRYRTIA